MQFLYEDQLLEVLGKAVTACLEGANTSRTFYSKSLAPGECKSHIAQQVSRTNAEIFG